MVGHAGPGVMTRRSPGRLPSGTSVRPAWSWTTSRRSSRTSTNWTSMTSSPTVDWWSYRAYSRNMTGGGMAGHGLRGTSRSPRAHLRQVRLLQPQHRPCPSLGPPRLKHQQPQQRPLCPLRPRLRLCPYRWQHVRPLLLLQPPPPHGLRPYQLQDRQP